jgi:hypothetical protein
LVVEPQSKDTIAPAAPTATVAATRHGKGPEGRSSTDRDDLGSIDLVVRTADDDQVSADNALPFSGGAASAPSAATAC